MKMTATLHSYLWVMTVVCLSLLAENNPIAAQQEEKLLLSLPASERVTVQKNIEYRKVGDKSLRFDFYRLPVAEKAGALPVVIFMNGFGSADQKESPIQVEWAKLSAASGLAAVTFESHNSQPGNRNSLHQSVGEDFDLLVAHLRTNQARLGVDADRIIVHASSGHAPIGLPMAMDKKRTFVKAAVIYYGNAEVKEFRLDLPVLFVRAGLDQPDLNRKSDRLIGQALAANAPFEIINHPGGQHPFEMGESNEVSREIIAHTLEFMHKAVSPAVQDSIRATMDEAAAGAALLTENWPAAVSGYAALVAKRPQDHEMHRRYADALFGAKEYAKATQAYEQAFSLGSWRKRDISYPAAIASVRANDVEGALKWIERLIKTPFDRTSLRTDPNFEPLRDNQRFRGLIEGKNQ